MKYIKLNSTSIECSHPEVDKIWMLGGQSMYDDKKLVMAVNIVFKDGNRSFFEDSIGDNYKSAIEKAEEYLQSFPKQK